MEIRIFSKTCNVALVASLLFGAGMTIGCGSHSAAQPPATPADATERPADDDATTGIVEHHRYHHGGLMLFVSMSLDTIGVLPEQQTVLEQATKELRSRMEPARTAEQQLMATLADGLAAGNVDAAKVDAGVAQVTAQAREVHTATADVLNQLHAVLTRPQRTALADKVMAHWAIWEKANANETGPEPQEAGHLASLTTALELTPDQVSKIRGDLAESMKAVPPLDLKEVDAQVRAFADAFKNDQFDAKTLSSAGDADAHMVGWAAAHLARVVETVSPVLGPDQRTAFADRLHEHASHDPTAEANP